MCRALLVVCLAPDRDALMELKRATVGTEWELTPGATTSTTLVHAWRRRTGGVIAARTSCVR